MITKSDITSLEIGIKQVSSQANIGKKKEELKAIELEMQTASPNNSPGNLEHFVSISRQKANLEEEILRFEKVESSIKDALAMLELAEETGDAPMATETEGLVANIGKEIENLRIQTNFSREEDKMGCFVEINAGAGGTDSQDLAQSLVRMYSMWGQGKGYTIHNIDINMGEEAGIKSATLEIKGYLAFGYMKNESGVHRFVRISPFNANGKRQTSFVSVFVYPIYGQQDSKITILEKDIRIDTYRSSGAGGQHVNTTDSAVRITHIPTGLVAQSQSQRSQTQNKNEAMRMLTAKLTKLQKEEKEKIKAIRENSKADISWGNQIRNYVFQPYKLVKDLRSGYETTQIEDIMNGQLDDIMNSTLILTSEAQRPSS